MKNFLSAGSLFFFLLAILALSPAISAEEPPGDEAYLSLFYPQAQLASSATRRLEDVRTAPATIRVFTAEEISDLGARTLSDLLNTVSSVIVTTQTNSRDSIWMRGIRNRYNDKFLLLVDGMPMADPVYSHAPTDKYFPLESVERVEIILGPASALYGSNAYSGTVNVITKKAPEKPLLAVRGYGGNYDTWGSSVEAGFRKGSLGLYGWFSYFETDGDGLEEQRHNLPQTLKWNPKQRLAGGVTLDWKGWNFRLSRIHYYHTFYSDYDVPTWRWKDEGYWYNDTFANLEKKFQLSDRTSLLLRGYYEDYDSRNFWREFVSGKQRAGSTPDMALYEIDVNKNGWRNGAEIQLDISHSDRFNTTAGMTFDQIASGRVDDIWNNRQDGSRSRPFYISPHSLANFSTYVEESFRPNAKFSVLGGIRFDHLDLYGWRTTPRINAVFSPTKRSVFKLLYGEAFRSPSFREYFTVDLTGDFPSGNLSLKPERIRTLEASGAYWIKDTHEISLALFSEWTYDSIYAEGSDPYANHGGKKIRGLEARAHFSFSDRGDLRFSYSRNWTSLYNVPPFMLNGQMTLKFGELVRWGVDCGYVAKRPRDPGDNYYYDPVAPPYHRDDTGGYFLLNTTVRVYPVLKHLELSASIYNVLDRDYYFPTYEPTTYNDLKAQNRTFLVRIGYRF